MRICYVCADPGILIDGPKGAAAHVRGLIHAYRQLGHDVVVVAHAEDPDSLEFPVVPIGTPEITTALLEKGAEPLSRALRHVWNNVQVEQALRRVLDDFQPDLVYERYSPFGVAAGLMAERDGVQHVLEVNAPLAWEGKEYRQQALSDVAQALEQTAFASASLIAAVSQELKALLVAQGVPDEKLLVVPNGVDLEMFNPEAAAEESRQNEEFVVGFVGSLRPWHGVETLAHAFRVLAKNDRGMRLLIVGDGPQRGVMKALAEEFPGRVTLTGAVSQRDVPNYLMSMDVAVAPYPPLETFYYSPLKILEYMAAGRAIVASDIGQVSELIRHGKNGMLVPPGEADALASSIRTMADDDGLRRRLGGEAAREAAARHTWRHRAQSILDKAGSEQTPSMAIGA